MASSLQRGWLASDKPTRQGKTFFEIHAKEHFGNNTNRGIRMPLTFLMSLQHVPLPKKVVTPEDVRHVSVLKATGLIEAEIAPALDGSGKYKNARNAIVKRITKEGMAEINRMRTEESRSKLARRL
ncbi:hypothetical protein [Variovorax paradoxus]